MLLEAQHCLQERKGKVDISAEDSWRQSLIDCIMSRCVWALVDEDITQHMISTEEPSTKNWLFIMTETLSHTEFT
jgi:hypothetical protein